MELLARAITELMLEVRRIADALESIECNCESTTQAERQYDHIWDMYVDEFEDYVPDACKKCPNHPRNGGCGICHCTLGIPKIQ